MGEGVADDEQLSRCRHEVAIYCKCGVWSVALVGCGERVNESAGGGSGHYLREGDSVAPATSDNTGLYGRHQLPDQPHADVMDAPPPLLSLTHTRTPGLRCWTVEPPPARGILRHNRNAAPLI